MYLLSIVLGVGFGYFIASMMFRNERNSLIAQGRQEAEAEGAELKEQVKLQETRVQEIEKEREKDLAIVEQLREENGKLKVLHGEADERVAEARRSSDEYWRQVVAEARQEAADGGRPAAGAGEDAEERLRQAVADAREEVRREMAEVLEEAQRLADERIEAAVVQVRQETEADWKQSVAEARDEADERLRAAVEQARQEVESEWRQKLDQGISPVDNGADAAVAQARQEAEAEWNRKLDETRGASEEHVRTAVAQARQEAEAEWSRKLDETRGAFEEHVRTAVAQARQEAESEWSRKLDEARSEAAAQLENAVAQARQEAAAQFVQPTVASPALDAEALDAAVAEARQQAEEQWRQALEDARRGADFEREQAAAQASEAESKLAALAAELQQARELASSHEKAEPQATTGDSAPAVGAVSQESMIEAFRSVAAEALHANNEKFLDLARVALERIQETAQPKTAGYSDAVNELIEPIRETLAKVDSNLGQMERERQAAIGNLTGLVTNLIEQGKDLRRETTGLAKALRPAGFHGRWGEVQLRRVAELAGMVEHCDYDQQPAAAGPGSELPASGQASSKPAMVVHLPNRRDIVVDASVSLSAYLESLEALDETVRAQRLREHAAGVRSHLQSLSGAAYWNQFPSEPEFVVAFLPSETVFSAALEQDPGLIEFGAENRVILATPTTLIALLKATAYGWQQQKLADDARAVSELGKTLYERLISFTGHMDDLRRNLERSVDSYNRGVASLESRVLVSARRFQDLSPIEAPEIPTLDPVGTVPRSLRALESATGSETAGRSAPEPAGNQPALTAEEPDVPVIELPIVPPLAPIVVCEPRVVSEAHVVSEPRVVSEPTFVDESETVPPVAPLVKTL